jgi:hypothetical protein
VTIEIKITTKAIMPKKKDPTADLRVLPGPRN